FQPRQRALESVNKGDGCATIVGIDELPSLLVGRLLVIDPGGVADDRKPAAVRLGAASHSLIHELDFRRRCVRRSRRHHRASQQDRQRERDEGGAYERDVRHGVSLTKFRRLSAPPIRRKCPPALTDWVRTIHRRSFRYRWLPCAGSA